MFSVSMEYTLTPTTKDNETNETDRKNEDGKEQLLLLVSYLTICKAKNKWIIILLMDNCAVNIGC